MSDDQQTERRRIDVAKVAADLILSNAKMATDVRTAADKLAEHQEVRDRELFGKIDELNRGFNLNRVDIAIIKTKLETIEKNQTTNCEKCAPLHTALEELKLKVGNNRSFLSGIWGTLTAIGAILVGISSIGYVIVIIADHFK
jgi:hypothetical protein